MLKLLIAAIFLIFHTASFSNAQNSEKIRGVNIDHRLNEEDFLDIKRYGFNAVRASFAKMTLIDKDGSIRNESIAVLDKYMDIAFKNNIAVIIDPHYIPYGKSLYSTRPTDPIWHDKKIMNSYKNMLTYLSNRYKNHAAKFYIDLINEPAVPSKIDKTKIGCEEYLEIIDELIDSVDDSVKILIQSPMGFKPDGNLKNQIDDVDCLDKINWSENSRYFFSFHMYDPGGFTHQGVIGEKIFLEFKFFSGKNINQYIHERMEKIKNFTIKNKIQKSNIIVGEFGVSNYSGDDSIVYIESLIDFFEKNDWSWVFHSFRESIIWDPEYDVVVQDGVVHFYKMNEKSKRINTIKDKILKFNGSILPNGR